MKKLNNQMGMTLLEVILVVAILGILGGVSTVGVYNYQRSFGQLERDDIAKEIFVAAQNHLTAAYGAGYYGTTDSGLPGKAEEDSGKSVFYYVVNGSIEENSVLGQMLPFASIDETVRLGGSYLIRYQKDTGLVLDVFYCSRSGTPERYNHSLDGSEAEYKELLSLRGAANKLARRNWNEHILGWYGGAEAIELQSATLEAPTIAVTNAETLYVNVTNPNTTVVDSSGNSVEAKIRLLIKGLSSGTEHYFTITDSSATIVLDDITSPSLHFGNRRFDDMTIETDNGFIPGENIAIQAVAYSTKAVTNLEYSNKVTTNSLFESIGEPNLDQTMETAFIGNIRHLENLDAKVSNLGAQTADDEHEKFSISAAKQTDSFSWDTFQAKTKGGNTTVSYSDETGDFYNPSEQTAKTYYYPICPDYSLSYDGQNHSISKVAVKYVQGVGDAVKYVKDAGLFGSVAYGTVHAIKNLELLDFHVTGTDTAGALVGRLDGCVVTNVLARNSATSSEVNVEAAKAGGLIGVTGDQTSVRYSAAVQTVNGSSTAGGLIGTASFEIVGCYAGGHTETGSYEEWLKTKPYDVTGGTAGGLVGSATATITDSYSTCSVYGESKAGGFAGNASGSIENCYATGLVDGADGAVKYAFVAGGGADLSGNKYYMAINEVEKEGGKAGETEPMPPVSGYALHTDLSKLKPLDLNAAAYNEFTGAFDTWHTARAYDSALVKYYDGKYPLRTVEELGAALPSNYYVVTHYGDWPSPEVFFLNKN